MSVRQIPWGRIRLEIAEDRIWFRIAGSPASDALLFGLLGVGIWCIVCIPLLVMKARVSPGLYAGLGILPPALACIGAVVGKKAKETAFIVSLKPSLSLSLQQGEEGIVLPPEDILGFVTRERQRSTTASLVARTRRGEFVILPDLVCTRKAADTFGGLLTALLLERVAFHEAVRRLLEVRRRDYIVLGVSMAVFFALIAAIAFLCLRYL